jgi:gas vesicle protein
LNFSRERHERNGEIMVYVFVFLCLQNHPQCKQKLLRSLSRAAEDHKAQVQAVKDRFFTNKEDLAKVVKARSQRHRESIEDNMYG